MEASAQFFCTALPLFSVSLLSLFFVLLLNDRDIEILKLLRIYRCRSFHHKTRSLPNRKLVTPVVTANQKKR